MTPSFERNVLWLLWLILLRVIGDHDATAQEVQAAAELEDEWGLDTSALTRSGTSK